MRLGGEVLKCLHVEVIVSLIRPIYLRESFGKVSVHREHNSNQDNRLHFLPE